MILRGVRDSVENPFGDGVRGGDADGVLERVEVNVEMRGERSPRNAHALIPRVNVNKGGAR